MRVVLFSNNYQHCQAWQHGSGAWQTGKPGKNGLTVTDNYRKHYPVYRSAVSDYENFFSKNDT